MPDSVSSWIGAASGANSVSSWDRADKAADLGMPATRTDTRGASNTQAIRPGRRGASAGLVAILAGDSGVADMLRSCSGASAILVSDAVLRSPSEMPTIREEPAHSNAKSIKSFKLQLNLPAGKHDLIGSFKPKRKMSLNATSSNGTLQDIS